MVLDHSKLAESIKVYASRKPLKVYAVFIILLLSLGTGLIVWALWVGEFEFFEFAIFMSFGVLVFLGPCIAICLFRAFKLLRLLKAGDIILEFGCDEMRCYSTLSGPIGTIEWPDVVSFHPVVAMASPYAMVMIEHIHRPTFHETQRTYTYRYLVNSIDIDVFDFTKLLERFTGIKVGRTRSLQSQSRG